MKLQHKSSFNSQERRYAHPVTVVITIEIEDTLAKSNTEQIIEDDDEYGWD